MSEQLDFTFDEDYFVPLQEGELLAPIQAQAEYYPEYGDDELLHVPMLLTLAANNIDAGRVREYAEELRFSCGLYQAQEGNEAEREEIVRLLVEIVDLLEYTGDSDGFPTNELTDQVRKALLWARFWAGEPAPMEDPAPDTEIDNVLFVNFGVHPDYRESIPTPLYLWFDLDPPISLAEQHSYQVYSPDAALEVKTDGETVEVGFGQASQQVGSWWRTIEPRFDSGCFRVKGVVASCKYQIRGGRRINYAEPATHEC